MSFLMKFESDKLTEFASVLPSYEEKIQAAAPIFKVEGRRLEEIARTLPHYQSSYDQTHQELKALEDWVLNLKEKVTSRLWKKYNEGYSRQLSTRDIQAYIAGEPGIVEINQILIEIKLHKDQCAAIVEALKQLGWMVSHITKLRVAEMQDAIL